MPKNKFQEVIFTIIMVFFMVYAMICYNIVLNTGAMTNSVFLSAFRELTFMGPIAFVLDFFLVSKLAFACANRMVDFRSCHPFSMILAISVASIAFMCPLMSFFAIIKRQENALWQQLAEGLLLAVMFSALIYIIQIYGRTGHKEKKNPCSRIYRTCNPCNYPVSSGHTGDTGNEHVRCGSHTGSSRHTACRRSGKGDEALVCAVVTGEKAGRNR